MNRLMVSRSVSVFLKRYASREIPRNLQLTKRGFEKFILRLVGVIRHPRSLDLELEAVRQVLEEGI